METSTTLSVKKDEIRREALRRRDAMPADEREAASLIICQKVMQDNRFLDARAVHVYLPMKSEVNIMPLVDVAWEMGMQVGMMHVDADGGTRQYAITPKTHYRTTKLGILAPIDAEPFDMDQCDLVICPLVAADESCDRIGYGKGYYDQFLAHYPRPTIGVAFECQIFPLLPTDECDITIDAIYTERRVITSR